jgi:phosphoglycerate dehydrogenase-like enzyme
MLAEAIRAGGGRVVDPGGAEALVWTDPMDAEALAALLAAAPGIRWEQQLPFAGIDRFVPVLDTVHTWTSAKGSFSEPVAEHALALALAGLRQFPMRARARDWGPQAGRRLMGGRVTIVGGGGITEALLRLLGPFRVAATVVRRQTTAMAGAIRVLPPGHLRHALALGVVDPALGY